MGTSHLDIGPMLDQLSNSIMECDAELRDPNLHCYGNVSLFEI